MAEKRIYTDRRKYLVMAVARRRKKLLEKAVEFKGGTCIFCGYNRYQATLDFHHRDASLKDFGISMD